MMVESPAPLEVTQHVMRRLREVDALEAHAIMPGATPEQLADQCLGESAFTFAALTDDTEPVAVGGITYSKKHKASLWLLCTDRVDEVIVSLTRFIKKRLICQLDDLEVDAAYVASISSHKVAHRWMKILGGQWLCALPGYGKHGESFELFEWRVR